jgi:hypothetical protein
MKTKHHFIQICICTEHSTLVMRAIKPSPGRMFRYVSSHLLCHERVGLRYRLSKTSTQIWYAFFFNEKLGTIIMKTKHHVIQICIHTKHSTLVMRATKPSPGRMFRYVSSHLQRHERVGLSADFLKLVPKSGMHSSLVRNLVPSS